MSLEALIDDTTFMNALQSKTDLLPSKLQELVTVSAFAVDREVKGESPVISGNLQGATSIDNISDYSKRIYVDEGIAPYALCVIKGTRPHEIKPVNRKALYWEGAAYPVKVVHHPGNKANDYFARGVANAQSDIEDAVEQFKSWITE